MHLDEAQPQPRSAPDQRPARASTAQDTSGSSPGTAGRSKAPAAARHAQRPRDGEEAPAEERAPSTNADRPGDATPSPATRSRPRRHRQPVRSSQPPTVSQEQQPRHRPAETDGDRDGERERGRSDRITHSFSASAHRRRTPARQERPTPSRRLESLTPAAVSDSRQDSQRRRRFNSAFGEKTEPERQNPEETRKNADPQPTPPTRGRGSLYISDFSAYHR